MESELKPPLHLDTIVVHGGDEVNPTTGVTCPIFQTATYRFDTPEELAEVRPVLVNKCDVQGVHAYKLHKLSGCVMSVCCGQAVPAFT